MRTWAAGVDFRWVGLTVAIVLVVGFLQFRGLFDRSASGKDPQSTEIKPARSLFIAANAARAFAKVQAKEHGRDFTMLELGMTPGELDVQVAVGEIAHGYVYFPSSGKLIAVPVNIPGSASIAGRTFPASRFDPAVVDRLVAEVATANPALHVTKLDLDKNASPDAGSPPIWHINADGGGRTGISFAAAADGSSFVQL